MASHCTHRRPAGEAGGASDAGFTIVELVTVIVVIGILGAVAASRFVDNGVFAGRAAADQAKSMIRHAQKLAIAQNGWVFVRVTPGSFAVCSNPARCGNAASLTPAPGGSNSGSAATRAACVLAGNYVANWLCEGVPANVAVAGTTPAGGFIFDRMGRPVNIDGAAFQPLHLTFTSNNNVFALTVETETGYVH
nr:type II secretion system protein [uncultured Duganella sp.]